MTDTIDTQNASAGREPGTVDGREPGAADGRGLRPVAEAIGLDLGTRRVAYTDREAILYALAVGAAAAALGSWRWGVLALATSGLLVALLSRGRDVPAHLPLPHVDSTSRGLPRTARLGVALVFTGVVCEWTVSYWGATYLREDVGLRPATAVTASTRPPVATSPWPLLAVPAWNTVTPSTCSAASIWRIGPPLAGAPG